jgi:nucleotide-binding universal stress UspA family protein
MVLLLSDGRIDIAAIVATRIRQRDGAGPPFRVSPASISPAGLGDGLVARSKSAGGRIAAKAIGEQAQEDAKKGAKTMRAAEAVRRSMSGRRPANDANPVGPVVVCGIDDALAERSLVVFAADLVERIGGQLVLVHVQPLPLLALEPQIAFAARNRDPSGGLWAVARGLARLAADVGIAPTTKVHVGFGNLEERVLATARREDAALILIGPHAASRSGLPGNLAPRLVEQASCPIIVLPRGGSSGAYGAGVGWGQEPMAPEAPGRDVVSELSSEGGDVTISSIVCGVDGSRDARVALRLAAQLSRQLGIQLVVAHVVQPPVSTPGLGPTARQLTGLPVDALLAGGEALVDRVLEEEHLGDAKRRIEIGFPADRLADIADEETAELIVVGSRGRGAFKAAFLGSVSTEVIGVARCPVLVVPPAAAAALSERDAKSATAAQAI